MSDSLHKIQGNVHHSYTDVLDAIAQIDTVFLVYIATPTSTRRTGGYNSDRYCIFGIYSYPY